MKPDFVEYIQDHVVLGDGALGSYLYEKGVELGRNLDLLNEQAPETVYSAHEEYIQAGSQLIETNTFGANRYILAEAGAGDRVREINRAGAALAVRAAGHQVYVAGSVGPSGVNFPLETGEIKASEVMDAFIEQLTGLAEGGVDLFILETFQHLAEIEIAMRAARKVAPEIPIIAQMVYPVNGRNAEGIDALTCGGRMVASGAVVVGSNCGRGVDAMVAAIQSLAPLAQKGVPLSAFPNAGLPEMVGHRMIYPAQPAYMAARAAEIVRHGVKLIGGCCGTTPAHIHEFRKALKVRPVRVKSGVVVKEAEKPENGLLEKVKYGGFLAGLQPDRMPILVEIDPPTHLVTDQLMAGAGALAENGADAVTLGENPLAILRAGNLGLAARIKEEIGIQTIIHQTCRDLNGLGLQSRLMEAHLMGIEAVLAITGDSASATDQPGVSGVFDLDSFGLIRMLDRLNQGRNMAGRDIRGRTNFSIGAAFSFRQANPAMQVGRLEKKAALGARFAMTQPLFSREAVERMMEEVAHIDMLIFPGIFPLISHRNAEFLHNEVPGISVPAEIRRRLAGYEQVKDQRQAAMEFTSRLVEEIAPLVDGLYLISPLNKWEVALQFVKQARDAGWQGSGRHRRMLEGPAPA